MKVNDPEYQRALDVITAIPSNKVDAVDLSHLTDAKMSEYENQHEKDLRSQIRGYDDADLRIAAEEITKIGWTYTYNALGDYFEKIIKQQETINATINNE